MISSIWKIIKHFLDPISIIYRVATVYKNTTSRTWINPDVSEQYW
jgi:hypothetical protein